MRDKLSIKIEIILLSSNRKCRYIDRHMEDTEKGQSKHGWDAGYKCTPIYGVDIWPLLISEDFRSFTRHTIIGVKVVKRYSSFNLRKDPPLSTKKI